MHDFKGRRAKLIKLMKDNSALLLFSGVEIKKSADGYFDFEVNRNFYYLTGLKQENSILLITKIRGVVKEKIFTLAFDPLQHVWTGRRYTAQEAKKIANVESHDITAAFETYFENIKDDIKHLYLDLEPGILTYTGKETKKFALMMAGQYGYEITDIYPEIIKLRMVKDEYEVKLIRDSIHLTALALKDAISKIKPGMYEYEVAAAFEYGIKKHHGQLGFSTIAAGGKNGIILHYPHLDALLNDGDLLLLDLGGHNNMYTADISRTVPVNGTFTDLQKKIYSVVLACNKAVIAKIKPGKTLVDLQNFTREFLKEKLIALGLMTADEEISKYYYHGVSHHLGLDTHDPGDRSLPLVPGNVITVEPGLYFAKHGIGIRVEDNVLVTDTGATNLSIEIPKEIKDLVK